MSRAFLLFVLVLVAATPPAAHSARRFRGRDSALPFARSNAAQSVWAADAGWRECGGHCAWGLASCLAYDAQGHCLNLGDTCDRNCQSECRTTGGPLIPNLFDAWE
jgi:hypothetical protein